MKVIRQPKVSLVWSTPDPRRVVAIAARMTYSAKDVETITQDVSEDEIAKSVAAILQRHHWSVLRHVSFCFTISGVSRAFSHQLVRHTVGHAYEQRSQHYRTERDPAFVEPDTIAENEEAHHTFEVGASVADAVYDKLIERGVPKDDARFILPNAVETQLIWTCNAEALLNFIKARACRVNVPEIMSVAIQARKLVLPLFPELGPFMGPSCLTEGVCFEGPKFHKQCLRPWKSPTVLWSPEFPRRIELVGVGGTKQVLSTIDILGELKEEGGAE